jgi:predicted nucleotidyltransferase
VPAEASGKFVLRLPPRLHAALKRRAKESGMSLNGLCLAALQGLVGTGERGGHPGTQVPLEQVRGLLGDSLSGVLLFGSAARGEARESSDVDLLIVVDSGLPLTRVLYDRWDHAFSPIDASRLSPHFVHLPEDEASAGSLWYEAAVDGIVLFDREDRISRFLRGIRRLMAEGKLQRKSAYGHPYWIKGRPEVKRVQ